MKVKCNVVVLCYYGFYREELKVDEEFGSVKGRSWIVVLFGKIKVGILLLRIKGDIEGDMVGENGRSFFFCWLCRGDEGGEGNLVVIFLLVKFGFVLIVGEMVGKVDVSDRGMWVCWCEIVKLWVSCWGFFCFWYVDVRCDKSWVWIGIVILFVDIKNWEILVVYLLKLVWYLVMVVVLFVNWERVI